MRVDRFTIHFEPPVLRDKEIREKKIISITLYLKVLPEIKVLPSGKAEPIACLTGRNRQSTNFYCSTKENYVHVPLYEHVLLTSMVF